MTIKSNTWVGHFHTILPLSGGYWTKQFSNAGGGGGGERGNDETLNWLMHYCSGFHGMPLLHFILTSIEPKHFNFNIPLHILQTFLGLLFHWWVTDYIWVGREWPQKFTAGQFQLYSSTTTCRLLQQITSIRVSSKSIISE